MKPEFFSPFGIPAIDLFFWLYLLLMILLLPPLLLTLEKWKKRLARFQQVLQYFLLALVVVYIFSLLIPLNSSSYRRTHKYEYFLYKTHYLKLLLPLFIVAFTLGVQVVMPIKKPMSQWLFNFLIMGMIGYFLYTQATIELFRDYLPSSWQVSGNWLFSMVMKWMPSRLFFLLSHGWWWLIGYTALLAICFLMRENIYKFELHEMSKEDQQDFLAGTEGQ
jgi:hypothetical protein